LGRKAHAQVALCASRWQAWRPARAGRGRYALDFSHYEPVPPQVQVRLVEAYKPRVDED